MRAELWLLLIAAACLVAFLLLIAYSVTHKDNYGMWPTGPAMLGWLSFAVAVVFACLLVFVPISAAHDETVCVRFTEETGRDAKFARYSFWSWDCLVETDEGWTSNSNVVKMDD